MPPPVFGSINSYEYNTAAAVIFVFWNYCLTFGEEVEYIWRRERNRGTALFTVIRYIPMIFSTLIMTNNIALSVPASNRTCGAWLVLAETWLLVLGVCFEILLIMRVLALYGQNRSTRNGLITLLVCFNINRIIIFAIAVTGYRYGDYINSNIIHQKFYMTKFSSLNPTGLFIVGILPEAILFCLAVSKLVQTKRTYNIAVSKLLLVIVRDGTWTFAINFVWVLWNIIQFQLATQNDDIAMIWIAPVIGFTGSRLLLKLRTEARLPPGGTNVENSEIDFSPIDVSDRSTLESV